MKKLLALLLCLLCLTGCAATYDGLTAQKPMLTEYTVDHYYNFFGREHQHDTKRTVYAYDIYGNLVKSMEYQNDELTYVTKLRYDDRGNEIARTVWDHTGWFPKLSDRTRRTYDGQNRLLTSESLTLWGTVESGSYYSYDDEAGTETYRNESGEVLQVAWYDENGHIIRQTSEEYETVYEYDDRGNLTVWTSYKNGALYDRYEAVYDDRDRQILGTRYDAAGAVVNQTEYIYDDDQGTKFFTKSDGSRRVEIYRTDGRIDTIVDYDAEDNVSMIQRYYYRDILVPAEGGNEP